MAETRRVCNASRLEMWLRCSTWLHLYFPYGCAAQLLRMESAFRAMPRMRDVEPDLAAPTSAMLPGCCLDFTSRLGGARDLSRPLAFRRPAIKAERLAAHLWQQVVDERASEHVEKVGSNPTMDA